MSAPTTVHRIFEPFLARAGEVRLKHKTEELLLDIHAAVAEHSAERSWLLISSDPRFIDGSMSDDEVNEHLSRAVIHVLGVVGNLHVEHGLEDSAFNQRAAERVIDAFYRRCELVASHSEERGSA